MAKEDENLNKVRIAKKKKTKQKIRKDAIDVVHKEFYKIYYKTFIIIYSICLDTNESISICVFTFFFFFFFEKSVN